MLDLLREIEAAETTIKLQEGGARTTPLTHSAALSQIAGCEVYLKCEHLQVTGSFKFRGALNRLSALDGYQRQGGVTAASTGNHGLGVAKAAGLLNIDAHIYVPADASPTKLENITALGAKLHRVKGDCLAAETLARTTAEHDDKLFISPYNDHLVIAGQGTIGLEIARDCPDVDAVFVSVGGGGLIGGIGTAVKDHCEQAEIVGCWAENSPVLYHALDAGRIVAVEEQETLSDATAGNLEEGTVSLPVCQDVIDHRILASEAEIAASMRLLAEHERWMVEGAAALPLACLLREKARYRFKKVVVLLCGRNITLDKFLSVVN